MFQLLLLFLFFHRKYIYKHINNNQVKSEIKESIGNGNFFKNHWLWLHVVSKSLSTLKATASFLCCYWISGFWTAVWTRQMRNVIVPSENIFQSLTRKSLTVAQDSTSERHCQRFQRQKKKHADCQKESV